MHENLFRGSAHSFTREKYTMRGWSVGRFTLLRSTHIT